MTIMTRKYLIHLFKEKSWNSSEQKVYSVLENKNLSTNFLRFNQFKQENLLYENKSRFL